MKCSPVIPVPKKPAILALNDSRSFTLTSVVMKFLEHLMLSRLKSVKRTLLDPLQFTYWANRSVDDALNVGLHFILEHLQRPRQRSCLLPFPMRFTPLSLNSSIPCSSISGYNPVICQWSYSFLTCRKEQVRLAESNSSIGIIGSGSPRKMATFCCSSLSLHDWLHLNALELNTFKTVEVIVDFRKHSLP